MGVSRRQVPAHLVQRYGIRPAGFRWVWAVVAVVGAIAAASSLGLIARGLGSGGETKLIKWTTTGQLADISWSVLRYDNATVYCVLRAQDSARFDVGFAVLKVRDTATNPQIESKLALRATAFSVLPPECQTDPTRLTSPNFRAGLLPPAQQPPLAAPWQPLPAGISG